MNVTIKRALLSVSDKTGLVDLAKFLHTQGVELIATGGTAKELTAASIPFTNIEAVTGNPEAFGGRMKTLSFPFLSALLFRREVADDQTTAKSLGIVPIDLVVCNFYPFEAAKAAGVADAELVEQIDIGGPTMVRAAAKNFESVVVCTSPSQYAPLQQSMTQNKNATSLELRREFAVAGFCLTARYETMIAQELTSRFTQDKVSFLELRDAQPLRYGENPHQKAELYLTDKLHTTLAAAQSSQGKALSYNNLLDADAALRVVSDLALLPEADGNCGVAVVKHLNPCGLALAQTPLQALQLAWAGDPVSAFGGILAFTQKVNQTVTDWLGDKFIEVILAPAYSPEALASLQAKKNLRVLTVPMSAPRKERMLRSIAGGLLIQDEDEGLDSEFNVVTNKKFPAGMQALSNFALICAKHLKSNSIALALSPAHKTYQLIGAGMGQPNRIDSLKLLAGPRAKDLIKDCVLASDAFFPFPDIVEVAAQLGLTYLLQPGGSIKDKDVIAACDRLGIAMAFTGRRHFRH